MSNHRQIAITLILDLDKAEALRSLTKQQVDTVELLLDAQEGDEEVMAELRNELEIGRAFLNVLDVAVGHATL